MLLQVEVFVCPYLGAKTTPVPEFNPSIFQSPVLSFASPGFAPPPISAAAIGSNLSAPSPLPRIPRGMTGEATSGLEIRCPVSHSTSHSITRGCQPWPWPWASESFWHTYKKMWRASCEAAGIKAPSIKRFKAKLREPAVSLFCCHVTRGSRRGFPRFNSSFQRPKKTINIHTPNTILTYSPPPSPPTPDRSPSREKKISLLPLRSWGAQECPALATPPTFTTLRRHRHPTPYTTPTSPPGSSSRSLAPASSFSTAYYMTSCGCRRRPTLFSL